MNSFEESIVNLTPTKVIDASIPTEDYVVIDISKENKSLETFDISSSKEWEKYVKEYLDSKKAKVAYGGYLEHRDLYNRSSYFSESVEDQRNIHLGIDLWTNVDTPVLVALDGTVHSFQNNTNYGDYGPTIIIEHKVDGFLFYTLYGHLSIQSIENLQIGCQVKQGDVIGYLGDASVNGDYAPHLHFQIILDIQNNIGDYPGVSSKRDLPYFKENCPDPNLLLKIHV
jgi:murein DD-endopeptidase MepM/ murein hydrolase activator NlpD